MGLVGDAVRVNGIGDLSMIVAETGHLDSFFRVHSSEKAMANILSFAEVEDVYKIMYSLGQGFIVHLHDRDILFAHIGKLCGKVE